MMSKFFWSNYATFPNISQKNKGDTEFEPKLKMHNVFVLVSLYVLYPCEAFKKCILSEF